MKDLPMFMTEYGAASLVLREIPYQGNAYITIRDSLEPDKLLEDCITVCRAAGAEKIFATGNDMLQKYPFHTAILRMRCGKESVGETDAALFPVQEETLETWRELYNRKIVSVPNAAWMTQRDGKEMLSSAEGYFIHREGTLLGIGRVDGDVIRFVASLKKGAGCDIVRALCHAVHTDTVQLDVASTNDKAVNLYKSLGFVGTTELSRWYRIL